MFISLIRSLFLLVFLALCGAAFGQTTVTLQQGLNSYTGTTDTAADIDHPDAGFHSHEQIFIGYDNARFRGWTSARCYRPSTPDSAAPPPMPERTRTAHRR